MKVKKKQDDGPTVFFPSRLGNYKIRAYNYDDQETLVLEFGKVVEPALVRIHSKCLTGDVFGSYRCDCRAQLEKSLDLIHENGSGILIYMDQEGRGIGLVNKIRAYELQDKGYDTIEANRKLGFAGDTRTYGAAAKILKGMGIRSIRMITNNPVKMDGLKEHGIEVVERVPVVIPAGEYNERYLRTKREKMGHIL
jgi:3,4-dihydroxy 2-butanone 4-phosphate synthase / GTP cyclohydrolase II